MDGGGSYNGYSKLPRSSSDGLVVKGVVSNNGGGNGFHGDGSPSSNQALGYQPAGAQPDRPANMPLVREQDRFMPIANVIRIMRKVLPTHAKISDDAKETIQECVSEYISFITSEANERCQQEQRKTITAEDVLWAMSKLGFDDYIEPLSMYLQRYRDIEGDHRGSIRGENLPPIKRSASADMAGHLYPHFHHPHYHPAAMFGPGGMMGGGGGGYYRGDVSGGAGPSHGPPPLPFPHTHLPPHSLPPFDPFAGGGGAYK